jgi:PadR family transcriptional regulator PadR
MLNYNNIPEDKDRKETHCHDQKCGCHRGRVSRFIEPSLLLLLAQKSAHGYELMADLTGLGFYEGEPDPGAVYRNLRQMEKERLVESEWETSGSGPAKRLYRLTSKGEECQHSWAVSIGRRNKALENFLSLYKKIFSEQ